MKLSRLSALIGQSIRRQPRNFAYSSVGLVVSVGMFVFCTALGGGIRENVINAAFPIALFEVERSQDDVGVGDPAEENVRGLSPSDLDRIRKAEGVVGVYPKQRAKFKARLWGGKAFMGKDLHSEAFFDGVKASLVADKLSQKEGGVAALPSKKRALPCVHDGECPAGQECKDEVCEGIEYGPRFSDYAPFFSCKQKGDCISGAECLRGKCEHQPCSLASNNCQDGEVCVPRPCAAEADCGGVKGSCVEGVCTQGACQLSCSSGTIASAIPSRAGCIQEEWCGPQDCLSDAHCPSGTCGAGKCVDGNVCSRIPCRVNSPEDVAGDSIKAARGEVQGICGDGSIPSKDGVCEFALPCPSGTLCSTASTLSLEGYCERPVPVLFNPLLLELFNASNPAASAGIGVSEDDFLLGLRFRVEIGASNVQTSSSLPVEDRRVFRCEVVGMSGVAGVFSGTIPMPLVRGMNAKILGSESADAYESALIEVDEGVDIFPIVERVEALGMQLTKESQTARRAGTMVFLVTLIFAGLSLVILFLSAMNIGHTMMMLVYERRRELGILRSLGGSQLDIQWLVLGEAMGVGLFGAAMGVAVAFGMAEGIDALAEYFLVDYPFIPESFFLFEPWQVATGIGLGLLFSCIGALPPSLRAARLDPAQLVGGN